MLAGRTDEQCSPTEGHRSATRDRGQQPRRGPTDRDVWHSDRDDFFKPCLLGVDCL
jgi:hypothetical protein